VLSKDTRKSLRQFPERAGNREAKRSKFQFRFRFFGHGGIRVGFDNPRLSKKYFLSQSGSKSKVFRKIGIVPKKGEAQVTTWTDFFFDGWDLTRPKTLHSRNSGAFPSM